MTLYLKAKKFQTSIYPNTGAWVLENGFSIGTGE
tara:strand:- start:879 stop:980 length:102 start_codon:yes stop_codon:yes gene_type:complete